MTTTENLLVAVRAIHFAATLALFGEAVFALLAARSRDGANHSGEVQPVDASRYRRRVVAAWLIAVSSGACWLLLEATLMSGRTLEEGWDLAVLGTVIEGTLFGRAWSVRALLALALAAVWAIAPRRRPSHRFAAPVLAVTLSAGLTAGLAWAGHANARGGADGVIHHVSDGIHLLAAGAWLGGLAPLIATLRRLGPSPTRGDLDSGARLVARFGLLAAGCVGLLLTTGVINARYTLRSPMALLDTPYGHLLLIKLVLFALMLALAAANRARLAPALCAHDADFATRSAAARQLRHNAGAEQALGIGILVLVGVLGVSSPPMAG
jgi:copper resistance protein D